MLKIQTILGKIADRLSFPQTQRFFKMLYLFSLNGMNYGGGAAEDSGENNALNFVKIPTGEKAIIFDVGANQGQYARLLGNKFKEAQIFSFEPAKISFDIMKEKTKDIGNISYENIGFDKENGEITLYSPAEGSGLASVYQRDISHIGISMDKTEKVTMKTIDSFCAEQAIKKINLLKLDVEGNELNAMLGAKKMIDSGAIDYIQFEFGACNIDSKVFFRDIFSFLKNKYKIYRILKKGLFEIKIYREPLELFVTTNYLCELKKQ
jgi:FkbM family methyltransferase